ncbi:hypothetical protein [Muribaculum intestinale]|uniref:hypothetical protein n=1 Tax=Muribaculum intestinale TaxID=1796646 RepID=UPI0025B6BFE9|nr:hypothetical protein [Muribaculum intestinale]
MKQKLLNALKEGYKQLGLSESAFERVAAFGETFITSDEQIESFVKAAEAMLRPEQSEADKVRTELNAKIKGLEGVKAELEAKLNGNNPPEPRPNETPDIAALIEAALDKKLNPITERLTQFESTRAKETAVAALDKLCAEWDYAQGFPKERDEAKRIALKVYKAGGEQMTGEQLIAAFREEFDPAVKSKGVTDFSKPFQSDGAGGDNHKARFEEMAKRQEERQGAVAAN